MADYKAPLRDMRFVLNEVFEVANTWAQLPALADSVDAETVEASDAPMASMYGLARRSIPVPRQENQNVVKLSRARGKKRRRK